MDYSAGPRFKIKNSTIFLLQMSAVRASVIWTKILHSFFALTIYLDRSTNIMLSWINIYCDVEYDSKKASLIQCQGTTIIYYTTTRFPRFWHTTFANKISIAKQTIEILPTIISVGNFEFYKGNLTRTNS
jgi:hypothetical protein